MLRKWFFMILLSTYFLLLITPAVTQNTQQRMDLMPGVQNPWIHMQIPNNMFHPASMGHVGLVNPPIGPMFGMQYPIRPPLRPDIQQGQSPPSLIQTHQQTDNTGSIAIPVPLGHGHPSVSISIEHDNSQQPEITRESPHQQRTSSGRVKPSGCPKLCDFGYVCYGGGCQLPGESLCSPMCPDNYYCNHGHCEFAPCIPSCESKEVCKNKKCVPIPCEPRCDQGKYCDAGVCKTDPFKAVCDPPCPDGFRCHESASGNNHCHSPLMTTSGHFSTRRHVQGHNNPPSNNAHNQRQNQALRHQGHNQGHNQATGNHVHNQGHSQAPNLAHNQIRNQATRDHIHNEGRNQSPPNLAHNQRHNQATGNHFHNQGHSQAPSNPAHNQRHNQATGNHVHNQGHSQAPFNHAHNQGHNQATGNHVHNQGQNQAPFNLVNNQRHNQATGNHVHTQGHRQAPSNHAHNQRRNQATRDHIHNEGHKQSPSKLAHSRGENNHISTRMTKNTNDGNQRQNSMPVVTDCLGGCSQGSICDKGQCIQNQKQPLHDTGGHNGIAGLIENGRKEQEKQQSRSHSRCLGGCNTGFTCREGHCVPEINQMDSVVVAVRIPSQVKPVGDQSSSADQGSQNTQGDNSCRPPCASVDVCIAGDCIPAKEANSWNRPSNNISPVQVQQTTPDPKRCGNIRCTSEEYCFNGACIGTHTGDVRLH